MSALAFQTYTFAGLRRLWNIKVKPALIESLGKLLVYLSIQTRVNKA